MREFAGHSDIRATELDFVRREEGTEVAARRIQICLKGCKGEQAVAWSNRNPNPLFFSFVLLLGYPR